MLIRRIRRRLMGDFTRVKPHVEVIGMCESKKKPEKKKGKK